MGRLSPHTINCYKSKLKKLRRILPLMPESDPETILVVKQIEKLTNQLGKEMSDLEIQLARGPGRPRSQPIIKEYGEAKEEPTIEQLDAVRRDKLQQLRDRVLADPANADLIAREKESDKALEEMMKMANDAIGGDASEGPGKTTDSVDKASGTD